MEGAVIRRVNTTLALHKTQNAVCPFADRAGVLPAARARVTLNAYAMNFPHAFAAAGLLAALVLAPAPAFAQADYGREQRWADEIAPGIVVGAPVWIELKSGRKFLAIYAPNPKAASGVIVVHGLGLHPDWGLISVLRSQLAEQGYATLSVQMPVLAAEAKADRYPPLFPEAAERLGAAAADRKSVV